MTVTRTGLKFYFPGFNFLGFYSRFRDGLRGLCGKPRSSLLASIALAGLAGCGGPAQHPDAGRVIPALQDPAKSQEVVLVALGLTGLDYRFGGQDPSQGFDCSGLVIYVFDQALGLKLPHGAALLARLGRQVRTAELRPGDLVFFNTLGRPYSHVGVYIGGQRFVHAPNRKARVRVDSLAGGYYARRLEASRTLFR